MSRLVVVSNRVSMPKRNHSAQGGLAVAMLSAIQEYNGLWFGWDGRITESAGKRPSIQKQDNVTYASLPLSKTDYNEYYKGYSNSVLWPLFHTLVHEFNYKREFKEGYRRVNTMFARKLVRLLDPSDIIWIHDYHLIPLAHELRKAGIKQPMGFFLHIPFPPLEVLRILPGYEFLLQNLCEYDLLGFQADNDKHSFINCIENTCPEMSHRKGLVSAWNKKLRVGTFPIGISVDEVVKMATHGRTSVQNKRLKAAMLGTRQLIIGVERLDYSKGLVQRFRAFERLLERYPDNRGKIEFLQVAAPSRTDVPQYQEIRSELYAVAGKINGRFSEYDWTPLHYLNKAFTRATVMGFLSISRIGLVTPLRDGMNLVAKEFIAAQDPEDPGVLVLSCLAGAANEMEDALIVNPYDIDEVAEALETGMNMPLKERTRRWRNMMEILHNNNISHWAKSFLDALNNTQKSVNKSKNA
ncbi:MAG: alpha,alpha-trehalose-phosphate synthase (UDP-forming) [Gammaproteobacteria bacterium]